MRQALEPEWLRVRDAADYSGISQTELFRLCLDGQIQSVHKLKLGQAKGIRLINKPSLDTYVCSFLPGGSRNVTSPKMRTKAQSSKRSGKSAGSLLQMDGND